MSHEKIISELSKIKSSSTFLTLKGYKNQFKEIADYSIVFHVDYKNALKRSISILESYKPVNSLQKKAKEDILKSYFSSLEKDKEEKY